MSIHAEADSTGSGTLAGLAPPRAWRRAPDARRAAPPANAGELLRALRTAWSTLEPREVVRKVVASARAALEGVPGEEPVWYALLRGLEMLGEAGPIRVGVRPATLGQVAEAQARRFRSSPRLATLWARLEGSVAAARAARAVNPAYAPAQVALGRALLREGSPHAARALLEAVEQPERIQGGAVALARARVATGDPGKALLAAAREPNAPGLFALEPAIPDPGIARELDEVRGLARLALGAFEAGARSLLEAAEGCAGAHRALVAHAAGADVRRALARLARDPDLTPSARALAGALAGG